MNSLDWSHWTGALDWSTGLEYWSTGVLEHWSQILGQLKTKQIIIVAKQTNKQTKKILESSSFKVLNKKAVWIGRSCMAIFAGMTSKSGVKKGQRD